MRSAINILIIGISLIPLICSTSVSLGDGFHLPSLDKIETDIHNLWSNFKKVHEIVYNSTTEERHRFKIFTDHVKMIVKHNFEHDLGLHTYRLSINKYATLTNQEFRERFNGFRRDKNSLLQNSTLRRLFTSVSPRMTLPVSIDWRKQGLVTPVKNQGRCGSCWSFSATGALEAYHARSTGKLVSFSEQQLIDCSTSYGNQGCNGGFMDYAFKYVHDHGLIEERRYPYRELYSNGVCQFRGGDVATTCDGYVDIPEGNEIALQEALAFQGPVSVAIDASQRSFQFYTSGVYSDISCSSEQLDHGVLAVGYGVDYDPIQGRQEYYIVKNSWSEAWGDDGYIKIARNQENMCGISTSASYPIVSDKRAVNEMKDN